MKPIIQYGNLTKLVIAQKKRPIFQILGNDNHFRLNGQKPFRIWHSYKYLQFAFCCVQVGHQTYYKTKKLAKVISILILPRI